MSENHRYAMREADYSSTESSSTDGSDAGRAASDRPLIPACSPVLLPASTLVENIDDFALDAPPVSARNPAHLLPRNLASNEHAGQLGSAPLKSQTTTNIMGLTSQVTPHHFLHSTPPQTTPSTTTQADPPAVPPPTQASDLISFPIPATVTTSTQTPSTKSEIRTCHTCSTNNQWSYIRLSSGWNCIQGHENPRYCKKCGFDSQEIAGKPDRECQECGWCEKDQVFGKRTVSKKTLEKHTELEEGEWRDGRNWRIDVERWMRGVEREREDFRKRESVEEWMEGMEKEAEVEEERRRRKEDVEKWRMEFARLGVSVAKPETSVTGEDTEKMDLEARGMES